MFRYKRFYNSTGILHWRSCNSSGTFLILGPALVFPQHPAYGFNNIMWGGDLDITSYSNTYTLYDKYSLGF